MLDYPLLAGLPNIPLFSVQPYSHLGWARYFLPLFLNQLHIHPSI